MNFEALVRSMPPATYENLKTSLEIGKWPDGTRLTDQQKEDCMQLVLGYDMIHFPENQRIGFIDKSCASKSKQSSAPNIKIPCIQNDSI